MRLALTRNGRAVTARRLSEFTVSIGGESGSGKELVARQIHELSARRRGPDIAVNCAALVDSLLEAILTIVRGECIDLDDLPLAVRKTLHANGDFDLAMREADELFAVTRRGEHVRVSRRNRAVDLGTAAVGEADLDQLC